ncbi:amidase [Rhodococcus sp. ABRD24]|uniref:amidase n=1 Tax=Rhodococcus sp. ABRD24 TaxID=2507582 RepID=UPI00103D7A0D|nr:amidase [Rhodococcus sp. ABRD24]QBJ96760.1 amidase [Rhodococcus sp. ABRD24]
MTVPRVEPGFYSISELHNAYRTREFTPSEVVDDILRRARAFESLNTFITLDEDGCRAQAEVATRALERHGPTPEKPLLGIPVTVKDLIRTRGLRTTRGSLVTKDFVPYEDSPSVARLREAGAVIVGKTNTSEGGWKGDAANQLVGPSLNPWAHERSAGGSSGGAGVAAAMGFGPVAVGTDGAGSVRIPAAFCGVVGFKPTLGRIPYWPHSSDGLSHIGVLTRSVEDAARSVAVMSGPDPRDRLSGIGDRVELLTRSGAGTRSLRVGVTSSLGNVQPDASVESALYDAAALLREIGYDTVELDIDLPDPYRILDTIWAGHEAASHWENFDEIAHLLDPGYASLIRRGRKLGAGQLARAHDLRHDYTMAVRTATRDVDILLTPTTPITAFPSDQGESVVVDGKVSEGLSWTPYTYPFNLTGQPAVSMPAALDPRGLPIGIQFVGRFGDDHCVLGIAADYEANRAWKPVYPELVNHSTY